MTKPELQKIVIYLSLNKTDTNLMMAGIKLASAFQKELRLLYLTGSNGIMEKAEAEMDRYSDTISKNVPGLLVTCAVIKHPGRNFSRVLADEMEAIVLVAGFSRFKELAKPLRSRDRKSVV